MSYMLAHLVGGWNVDQAILTEEEKVVIIRFGHDWDKTCMIMDEVLFQIAEDVKNFAIIYVVRTTSHTEYGIFSYIY